jgi:hypothetical protein
LGQVISVNLKISLHWRLPMSNTDHETFLHWAIALSARASLEPFTGGVFGVVVV